MSQSRLLTTFLLPRFDSLYKDVLRRSKYLIKDKDVTERLENILIRVYASDDIAGDFYIRNENRRYYVNDFSYI